MIAENTPFTWICFLTFNREFLNSRSLWHSPWIIVGAGNFKLFFLMGHWWGMSCFSISVPSLCVPWFTLFTFTPAGSSVWYHDLTGDDFLHAWLSLSVFLRLLHCVDIPGDLKMRAVESKECSDVGGESKNLKNKFSSTEHLSGCF